MSIAAAYIKSADIRKFCLLAQIKCLQSSITQTELHVLFLVMVVVLSCSNQILKVWDGKMSTLEVTEQTDVFRIKAGGSLYPTSEETLNKGWHNIYQDGKTVFKYAVSEMSNVAEQIMKRNKLNEESLDYLVPHQANKRIIDATMKRLNLSPNKVLMNIEYYGNTTAATLPLLLKDYESKIKKGDKLVFAAFGGGFTWGAAHLTWSY